MRAELHSAPTPRPNSLAISERVRLDWVDGVRGIAILMVIAVHASHGVAGDQSFVKSVFSYGGFGVQLFFVASALTLCMSLERSVGQPNWLAKYCVRRYFRIAPMYYFGIVFYFFWSFAKNYVQTGILAPLPQYTAFNVFANMVFIHSFVPPAYNSIVPGGWSIGVEMVFYVLFPFIFLAHRKLKSPLVLSLVLLAAAYVVALWAQKFTGSSTATDDFMYFNVSNQVHVFLVGILGYYYFSALQRLPKVVVWGLIGLCVVGGMQVGRMAIPNARFLALTAFACAFVLLAVLMARAPNTGKWLQEVGRRSFSMYVIHFFVMNTIDYVFNAKGGLLMQHPNAKALLHFAVAVAVAYWLAGLAKIHIEDKFIALGGRIIGRLR